MMNSEMKPSETLVRAVHERDAEYDGLFVFGVRTTGVFCRPVCRSRRARVQNLRFFSDAAAAARAGFRACRRCRPDAPHEDALVERLLAAIESAGGAPIGGAELAALGISDSTARRRFVRRFGMTFDEFQRRARLNAARVAAGTRRVIDAQVEQGYESGSGFRRAFTAVFGTPPARAKDAIALIPKWIETPLGVMLALATDAGIVFLEFVEPKEFPSRLERTRKKHRGAIVPGENAHLEKIGRELAEYFSGERRRFDVPLAAHGTPFQKRVWRELAAIPAGETRSYAQVARAIGRRSAVRAVARANASNPIAVVVPCHRVIGSDGDLRGYAAGTWRKRRLIELERENGAR